MTDRLEHANPAQESCSLHAESLTNNASNGAIERLNDPLKNHRLTESIHSSNKAPETGPRVVQNPFESAKDRDNFPDFSLTMKIEDDEEDQEEKEEEEEKLEHRHVREQQVDLENASALQNQQSPIPRRPDEPENEHDCSTQMLNWSIDTLAELKPMDFSPLSHQKNTPQSVQQAQDDSFFENPHRYAVLKTPSPVVWREMMMHKQQAKLEQLSSSVEQATRPGLAASTPLHRRCVQVMTECEQALRQRQQRMNRLSLKLQTPSPSLPSGSKSHERTSRYFDPVMNLRSKLCFEELSPITPLSITTMEDETLGTTTPTMASSSTRKTKRSRHHLFSTTPTIQEEEATSLSSQSQSHQHQPHPHPQKSMQDVSMGTEAEDQPEGERQQQQEEVEDPAGVNTSAISSIDLNESTVVEMHMPSFTVDTSFSLPSFPNQRTMEMDATQNAGVNKTKEPATGRDHEQEPSSLASLSLLQDQSMISHRQDSFVASLEQASQESDSEVEQERSLRRRQQQMIQRTPPIHAHRDEPDNIGKCLQPKRKSRLQFRAKSAASTCLSSCSTGTRGSSSSNSNNNNNHTVTSILQEAKANGLTDRSLQWEYLKIWCKTNALGGVSANEMPST